jgi:hypothetical protein
MMNHMKLAALLALLIPLAARADVVIQIGELTITMPDGYRHTEKRGIDSAVGEIVATSGIKIEYDIGRFGGCPQRLQEMTKEELANVLYFEDHPANAPIGFILVTKLPNSDPARPPAHAVQLSLGKGVGGFGLLVADAAKLAEARKALEALKITKK